MEVADPDAEPDATPLEIVSRPWLAVALVARPENGCAFPLGEIDDETGFAFCGAELASGARAHSPYCRAHHAIAYLLEGETQEDRDLAATIA